MVRPSASKNSRKRKQYTVEELVNKAEELVDQCQPDLAIQFYEKALVQAPKNTQLLDAIGELATELDEPEKALEAFRKSLALEPASNPSKWFYAAQLVTGEEAERMNQEGIAYLLKELQQLDQQTEEALAIKKQICDAYCALGELYMTDLCDVDDAEVRCETFMEEALKYDIGLPEPKQALANLRLTQKRVDEAAELLEETYQRLCDCEDMLLPPMEFRIFTGKLLIEVGKFEQAADVLEQVMQEDDDNAELWFLVGTCYQKLEDYENALEFMQKCAELLEKLKKQMGDEEFHLQHQLDEVYAKAQELETIIAQQPATHTESEEAPSQEDDDDHDEEMDES